MRMSRFGLLALSVLCTGCFTLEPAAGVTPEPGNRLALDINDVGRVALGGVVGPEIAQIEGRLIGKENDEYHIAVSMVRFLRGGEQVWSGERIRVRSEHVGTVYERRYSTGRSVALGVASLGGLTAIILSRDLLGLGTGDNDNKPDPKPPIETELIRP